MRGEGGTRDTDGQGRQATRGSLRAERKVCTHVTHEALEDHQLGFQLLHLHGQLLLAGIGLLGLLQPGGKEGMMSMWESMGGAGLGLSGAAGKQGLRGGRPHLLELVHSLLQLDSHCVLLFPSDRRGEGGENRPGVPPATPAPAPPPP